MKYPWLALIAVFCNVGAQLSMKNAGATQKAVEGLAAWMNIWVPVAVGLYGISFLLTMRIFAVNSLSIASPAMAGATFTLVTVSSWIIFGEPLYWQKLLGIGLIFAGIVLLTQG